MVTIPENPVTQADLSEWYRLKQEVSRLQASERLLRAKIFGGLFPEPTEGTNSFALADGYVLKATHKIDRTIDEAALSVNKERYAAMGISIEKLVRLKPELTMRAYRALTDEQRNAFDESLTIKPGSPSLDIVLPKKS